MSTTSIILSILGSAFLILQISYIIQAAALLRSGQFRRVTVGVAPLIFATLLAVAAVIFR